MLYAGGGVLSARATAELAALAEALEVPVAHTLMGKGCLREDHPLLLGMTGFWGTPIANEKCRTADLILAVGTRLAEANSSSWDPRFTFVDSADAPDPHRRRRRRDRPQLPDRARRGRRREAGARRARRAARRARRTAIARRAARRDRRAAAGPSPRTGRTSGARTSSRCVPSGSSASCARRCPRTASSSPTSAGTRTASASSFRSRCPARSSRRAAWRRWGSGRRRCSASRWRSRIARRSRSSATAASAATRRWSRRRWKRGCGVVWLVMDNAAFGTIAGLDEHALRLEFGCLFERDGAAATAPTTRRWRKGVRRATACSSESADELGPALTRGARLGPADGHPGADGERADADAGPLGHQRHLPERELAAGGHDRQRRRRSAHARALGSDPGARRRRDDDQLPRSDGARHRRAVPDEGSRAHRGEDGAGLLRVLVELRAAPDSRAASSSIASARALTYFIAVVFWSLCTALMGVVRSLNALLLTRIGVGVFEAPCFPANSRILATWFPQHERARANAIYSFGQYVGLGFLSVPLFWITQRFGWRGLFFIVGGLGVALRPACGGCCIAIRPTARPSTRRSSTYIEAGGGGEYKGAAGQVRVAPHRRAAAAPAGARRVARAVRRQLDAGVLRHLVSDLSRDRARDDVHPGRLHDVAAVHRRVDRRARRRLRLGHAPEADRIGEPRAQAADRRRHAPRVDDRRGQLRAGRQQRRSSS